MEVLLDLADLVEKDRAFVGGLEHADPVLIGPGKRPAHVAEQLAFEERRRDRATIDRHKVLGRPIAEAMHHAGNQLRHHFVDLDHAARAADHLALRQILGLGFLFELAAGGLGALHRLDHPVELERLGNVIERAAASRRHHGLHGAAGRHEDHRATGVFPAGRLEHVEPGAVVDVDIGDDDRVRRRGEAVDRFLGRRSGVNGVALELEAGHNRGADARVVFHYQQSRLRHHLDSTMLFTFCVGNTKVKQEPRPGLLVTSIEPPCWVTICSTIERPMPVPASPDSSAFLVR